MPQPLSRVKPDASYRAGDGVFEAHPDLTALVLGTISHISRAENERGHILSQLLGSDGTIGIAMYLALTSSNAQASALKAAATSALTPEDLDTLERINKRYKPAFARRNEFAHGIWAISDEIENALLLIDSRHYLDAAYPGVPVYLTSRFVDPSNIAVYRKKDLERDCEFAKETAKRYHLFSVYLSEQRELSRLKSGKVKEKDKAAVGKVIVHFETRIGELKKQIQGGLPHLTKSP